MAPRPLEHYDRGGRRGGHGVITAVWFAGGGVAGARNLARWHGRLRWIDLGSANRRRLGIAPEAMGFGDVTLMAMIGSFLGWQTSPMVFFLAPLAGLVVGLIQWFAYRDNVIPYGPFLCLAARGDREVGGTVGLGQPSLRRSLARPCVRLWCASSCWP